MSIYKYYIMEQVRVIPTELLNIIPKFDGDLSLLNLYIRKCEYIIRAFCDSNNLTQNTYVFHSVTSKLVGKAAALLSEREDINNWDQLKPLLVQHFGDPRSEECIALELEGLKIKNGESYSNFCHRIQQCRSSVFAKVNRLQDEGVKAAKMIIYNDSALKVFLYNLPEEMIRIVRLKGCTTLETALSIVTEEENFLLQYNTKKQKHPTQHSSNHQTFKPLSQPLFNSNQNMKFGTQPQFKFGISQGQSLRPQFSAQAPKFNYGIPNQPRPQAFGYRPPQFGYRPPQFGERPLQIGYRPQGYQPQPPMRPQQFGQQRPFNNVQTQRPPNNDVSMRTAQHNTPQGFRLNETDFTETENYTWDPYVDCYQTHYDPYDQDYDTNYLAIEGHNLTHTVESENSTVSAEPNQPDDVANTQNQMQNFYIRASNLQKP